MTSSCSFRITRTAEDLAQTVNALSQRLVKLEHRLEALEGRLGESQDGPPPEEIEILDGVEKLLRECHELLETSSQTNDSEEIWTQEQEEVIIAA